AKIPQAAVVTAERFVFVPHLPHLTAKRSNTQGLLFGFDPLQYEKVDTTDIDGGGASRTQVYDEIAHGQVTVGKGYADEANIGVGDALVLTGPSGKRTARVAGIVDTVLAGGQTVGMSLGVMRQVYGVTADSTLALKATSAGARSTLDHRVSAVVDRDYPN